MTTDYPKIKITGQQAEGIVSELFGIKGAALSLPGELDFNFRIESKGKRYLLKVGRPDANYEYLEFQQAILQHVAESNREIVSPVPLPDLQGIYISETKDDSGNIRMVRLLTWVEGRLWSGVNPVNNRLLYSLGEEGGRLSLALQGFEHPLALRDFEWDVARAGWTAQYEHLFTGEKLEILQYFQKQFSSLQEPYSKLRKSVVHNDANDNNVVVSDDLIHPRVKAIIDYGDAIHTQIINDLAITIAYAVMGKPDPLSAAIPVVAGYHSQFPLLEEELSLLYVLVAMRLAISVTKSAINRLKEPDNEYLLISDAPAWELLKHWRNISREKAHFGFRHACGLSAHPRGEGIQELGCK